MPDRQHVHISEDVLNAVSNPEIVPQAPELPIPMWACKYCSMHKDTSWRALGRPPEPYAPSPHTCSRNHFEHPASPHKQCPILKLYENCMGALCLPRLANVMT